MDLSIFERPRMLIVGGLLTIVLYVCFTLTSWALFPGAYWPTENYLSRLGDLLYSPFGGYFYNIGCVLTGVALFPFFLGLRYWWTGRRPVDALLLLGQVLGVLAAIALVMIGVYSEDTGAPHMAASATFFLLNFFMLATISLALLFNAAFPKLFAIYGLLFDLSSFAISLTIGGPITEWYTVFGSLLFVGIVVIATHRGEGSQRS